MNELNDYKLDQLKKAADSLVVAQVVTIVVVTAVALLIIFKPLCAEAAPLRIHGKEAYIDKERIEERTGIRVAVRKGKRKLWASMRVRFKETWPKEACYGFSQRCVSGYETDYILNSIGCVPSDSDAQCQFEAETQELEVKRLNRKRRAYCINNVLGDYKKCIFDARRVKDYGNYNGVEEKAF